MKGATLIDVLIGTTLVLIIFLGVFGLYELGLKVSYQSQHRTIATGIANEYMERTRNLSYNDVGVIGGYPSGRFKPFEVLIRNNNEYGVTVNVHYVADPADGIGYPEDSCPNDYKRVVVSVGWMGSFPGEVSMATNVAPLSKIEECGSVGGILRMNVIDPFGQPVPDVTILIDDINGPLSNICITGLDGLCQLILPSSPDGQGNNYFIKLSKSGWSQARTFGSGDIHNGFVIANPTVSHASLLSGKITEMTFSIGKLSAFRINTISFQAPNLALGFVGLNIRGSKIVGYDANEVPIFKYEFSHTTDAGGKLFIPGLEWDNYRFTAPGLTIKQPEGDISLGSGVEEEVFLYLDSDHSLIVNVGGSDESTPLFSASVRLFNGTDKTLLTDKEGRVIFIPLDEGVYDLEVIMDGYEPFRGQVSVSGNITKSVSLVLNPG